MKDGQWIVPKNQRPSNWRQYAKTSITAFVKHEEIKLEQIEDTECGLQTSEIARTQVGMAELAEVFLVYRQVGETGKTFWELVQAGGKLALPPAPEDKVRKFPEAKG